MKRSIKENQKISALLLKSLVQAVLTIGALCLFWTVAYYIMGNALLVPSFLDSMKALGTLLQESTFWIGFFGSIKRVLIAFVFSFFLAGAFALGSYLLPVFRGILLPILSLFRSLPTLAVLLILLVVSGAGEAPIIVAFLSLFPLLYTEFLTSLLGIDKSLLEMSKVYKVPLKRQIFKLYLPSIFPSILQSAGAGVAFALKLVVSAEVLAQTYQSLGGLMQEAKLFMEMPRLFALVCVTFIVGVLLEVLTNYVSKRCRK